MFVTAVYFSSVSGFPHSGQNFDGEVIVDPQLGHFLSWLCCVILVPQFGQNLVPV